MIPWGNLDLGTLPFDAGFVVFLMLPPLVFNYALFTRRPVTDFLTVFAGATLAIIRAEAHCQNNTTASEKKQRLVLNSNFAGRP